MPNILLFPSNTFQKKPTFVLPRRHRAVPVNWDSEGPSSLQSGQYRGKTNSFIVMFFGFRFCFFNKQTAWEGEILW